MTLFVFFNILHNNFEKKFKISDLAGTSEGDDEITAKAKQALQARRESVIDSPLAPSNGKKQTAYIGKFTKIQVSKYPIYLRSPKVFNF